MSIIAVCAALAAFALVYTLWVPAGEIQLPQPPSALDLLLQKKKVIYDNLKDLNFEYRTGKLSDDDYQKLKTSLQYDLAAVMQSIEEQECGMRSAECGVIPHSALRTPHSDCPKCGHSNPPEHKHCSQCGARLVTLAGIAGGLVLAMALLPAVSRAQSMNESGAPASSIHAAERAVIVQPQGGKLLVSELYLIRNDSKPPATYAPAGGSFRFFVPEAARASVRAAAQGADGMPVTLQPKAEPSSPGRTAAGLMSVSFPLKPGESRIEVSYHLDYPGSLVFESRAPQPIEQTRIAVAPGVTAEGQGLRLIGTEPRTKFAIYELSGERWSVKLSGESQIPSAAASGRDASDEQSEVFNQPSAAGRMLYPLLATVLLALAAGFFRLWRQAGA